ncbi:hypothetical protein BV898_15531 [Hypsibius exemplaris]|uniref:Receptor ligand binding region domain-containing protein n=1 Tax=Hypsibius exemplaris TaxID=2072580 RepID=A0A9X6NCZ9_HYPEX|nr:hypothetical protein BV898_15531 [Hypsibius exemplaris]
MYPLLLGGLQYVGPAYESAREDIRRQYPKLNFTQTFIYGENAPYSDWIAQYENVLAYYYYKIRQTSSQGTLHVTAFVMAGGDDTIGSGRFATELDKLLISSAAQAPDFRNKEKWPTWITTAAISNTAIRRLYENLIPLFNWWTSVIVCDINSNIFFQVVSEYIRQALVTVVAAKGQVTRVAFDSRTVKPSYYGELMRQLKESARESLRKILIFLAFLPFRHASFGDFHYGLPATNGSSTTEIVKAASKCLLIMEPLREPDGESTKALQSIWKRRSKELDNNTYIYGTGEKMSPHPTATYISMMALAEVLEEIRQETSLTNAGNNNDDAFSGRKIAARFLNRTLVNGKTEVLTIDRVGERIIPMAITQLDLETGSVSVRFLTST